MTSLLHPVAGMRDWLHEGDRRQPRLLLQYAVGDAVRRAEANFDPGQIAGACAALWKASQGDDIDYGLHPAIGAAYASWYHLQRVNTAAHAILSCFEARRGSGPLVIYDLGSGTGAVAWVVGLVLCWMRERGLALPGVTVVSVESCTAMHDQAQALWVEFRKRFRAAYGIRREHQAVPWQDAQPSGAPAEEVWVTASYLFDHGDRERGPDLALAFRQVVDRLRAAQATVVTSFGKSDIVQAVLPAAGLYWSELDYQLPIVDRERIRPVQGVRDGWRQTALALNAPDAENIKGPVLWIPRDEHAPYCAHGSREAPRRPARAPITAALNGAAAACATCGGTGPYAHQGQWYCKVCYLACADAPLATLGDVRSGACHACGTRTQLLASLVYAYCRTCFPTQTGLRTALSA